MIRYDISTYQEVTKLEIRKGTMRDIDELSALYDDVTDYLETHINYPGWRKGIYPNREDAEHGIQENTLFVAQENQRLIGTIILSHQPEEGYALADWHNTLDYEDILVIYTFAVHPSYLKQGIGRKILQFTLDYSVQSETKAVRLDVYEKNTPAICLYESMGFQYIDTVDLGYSMYGLPSFRLYQKILGDIY